jgi:hypothetical protein
MLASVRKSILVTLHESSVQQVALWILGNEKQGKHSNTSSLESGDDEKKAVV